ncbi:MAG: hypothetical protein AABY15_01750 [Nanoarchaeota archaeon]
MNDSNIKNKLRIQKLIDTNTARAGGDFHEDGLDSESFLSDLKKNFKLTPKEPGVNSNKLLENTMKSSITKVIGRFNSKTFKQSLFIKKLFDNFEIEKI